MTIKLITKEQHERLLTIQRDVPNITFQNNGYEYIPSNKMGLKEMEAIEEVSDVLKGCIEGFRKFHNFKLRENGKLVVRIKYQWDSSFTGVGYVGVDELLNGFDN